MAITMEFVITVLIGLLAFMVGVCTFFVRKWLTDVENRLHEHEVLMLRFQDSTVSKDTLKSMIESLSEQLKMIFMRLDESIANEHELARNVTGLQTLTETYERRIDNLEKDNRMSKRGNK